MENTPAFDLNDAIRGWRENLGQSPSFRPEDLDELETHLRDSVAAMRHTTLSEEECFWIAHRRLGGPASLEPEFAKVNPRSVWTDRLLWMLTGILLWWAVGTLAHMVTEVGVLTALVGFGYRPSVANNVLPIIVLALGQIATLALCTIGCAWALHRAHHQLTRFTAYVVHDWLRLVLAAAFCTVLLVAAQAALWIERAYLLRHIEVSSYGAIQSQSAYGSFVTLPLQLLLLAGAALIAARHRLRRSSNQTPLPEDLCRR